MLDTSLAQGDIGLMKGVLPSEEVVLHPSWDDVDEVVGDSLPLIRVLGEIFACPYVHTAIDLARVRTEDL